MARPRITAPPAEAEATILEWVRKGATLRDAAEAAGVAERTLHEWKQRFPRFLQSLTHAEAECAASYAGVIRDASIGIVTGEKIVVTETVFRKRKTTTGSGPDRMVVEEDEPFEVTKTTIVERTDRDWRAAESWLKRRKKEDWSERQEVSGPDGGAMQVDVQYRQMIERVYKDIAPPPDLPQILTTTTSTEEE